MSRQKTDHVRGLTPGEWEYDNTREYYGSPVVRANGMVVALVCALAYDTHGHQDDNGRLIAAAKDLLEACKAAYVALPMAEHNEATNEQLKAAIAKASGYGW